MTISEKVEMAELIRSIVREELQRVFAEKDTKDTKDTATITTTGNTENARAYLKKISPMMTDYVSRYTLADISHEMKAVLTDDEIKYVIIHLDSNDAYSKKNGKDLSEMLFK